MVVTIRLITQIVIPRGIQIRSPVMKYFFTERGRAYWQAGQAPAPQAGAAGLSPEDPDFSRLWTPDLLLAPDSACPPVLLALAASFLAGLEPAVLEVGCVPPEPFSWKPAADTSLAISALPQLGQSVMGASLSFWRYSFSNPQLRQRYS